MLMHVTWSPEGTVIVLTCIAAVVIPATIKLVSVIFDRIETLQKLARESVQKAEKAENKADAQGAVLVQAVEKINEVADKNAADVAPMPVPSCPPPEETRSNP